MAGQESVWDYPRPPRLERSSKRVEVFVAGHLLASTTAALRVLETSHPPVYYIPLDDIDGEALVPSDRHTYCEFKGAASYYDLVVEGATTRNAGWYYPSPSRGYEALADHVAFYPGRVERCLVDGEEVTAQAGDFYGGWITADIVGPFKGQSGTSGW
ncbi:MAG: DUF427 domain-containing protein [Candidatus Dormibacteria bacterium]